MQIDLSTSQLKYDASVYANTLFDLLSLSFSFSFSSHFVLVYRRGTVDSLLPPSMCCPCVFTLITSSLQMHPSRQNAYNHRPRAPGGRAPGPGPGAQGQHAVPPQPPPREHIDIDLAGQYLLDLPANPPPFDGPVNPTAICGPVIEWGRCPSPGGGPFMDLKGKHGLIAGLGHVGFPGLHEQFEGGTGITAEAARAGKMINIQATVRETIVETFFTILRGEHGTGKTALVGH